MVKNKVLTPVLAGVLGLSIVGSGVGYYFVNKNSDNGNTEGGKAKLTQVADNINNTLGKAEKAVKGKLDFAYNANATVSFGEGFTKAAGLEVAPISVTTATKQKGSNTGVDFAVSYNSKNLVSANAVYGRDDNKAYVQIPELSDGYLMLDVSKVEDELKSQLSEQGIDLDSLLKDDGSDDATVDFDTDAFEKDLDEYEKLIKDTLPQPTEGDKLEGDIDGNKYSYTTKEYEISGQDALNVINAVLDKAKTDENIKKLFDQSGIGDSASVTYEEIIDEMRSSMDFSDDDLKETVKVDVYYNGEDFAGFAVDQDDVKAHLYTISTDDVLAVDLDYDFGSSGMMTVNGALKTDGDTTNGKFAVKTSGDVSSPIDIEESSYIEPTMVTGGLSSSTVEAEITFKDIKTVEDTFTGVIRTDVNVTNDGGAQSGWLEIASASTADKLDLSFELGVNGEKMMNVSVTGNETEASDVTMPTSDKIYDVTDDTQMDNYLSSCDTDKFTANIKAALGDELYNLLTDAESDASSLLDDDYDYDDNYDYDDSDFSYFDEDYDLSDLDLRAEDNA